MRKNLMAVFMASLMLLTIIGAISVNAGHIVVKDFERVEVEKANIMKSFGTLYVFVSGVPLDQLSEVKVTATCNGQSYGIAYNSEQQIFIRNLPNSDTPYTVKAVHHIYGSDSGSALICGGRMMAIGLDLS